MSRGTWERLEQARTPAECGLVVDKTVRTSYVRDRLPRKHAATRNSTVRMKCFYSVPARYAGRRLQVRLAARAAEVFDGSTAVARHERAAGKFVEILSLDHYLVVLKTKPAALPSATAFALAKAGGVFTASHKAYWDAARTARGDAGGTLSDYDQLLSGSGT